jgi:uncharacterized YccA/Bax inhibitor family protein
VYVVSVLAAVFGILLVFGGASNMVSDPFWNWYPMFALFGFLSLLVGVLDIAVAYGFYYARRWSGTLGIIASLVTVVFSALTIEVTRSASVNVGFYGVSPFAILYPLAVVYSITRTNVQYYFSH